MDLLGHHELVTEPGQPHLIRLEAFGYRWFRVGGVNYALRRHRI